MKEKTVAAGAKKILPLLAALLLAGTAQAAEKQSRQVEITLELSSTCILNVNNVQGFGAWPTGGDNISGATLGSVSIACADGLAYGVGIDAGEHYDGTSRRLTNDTDYVPYVLRATSSGGPEWGDTGLSAITPAYVATHPAAAVQGTGNGAAQTISLWGDTTIPNVTAGKYEDRVNITLVW